jgi:hypothetical protein
MVNRVGLGLLVFLLGCDDYLFGESRDPDYVAAAPAYSDDWDGVKAFMADHCDSCHPAVSEPDLVPAMEADILSGAGEWIVVGDPEASFVYQRIVPLMDYSVMPPGDQLDVAEYSHIESWILAGAPLD